MKNERYKYPPIDVFDIRGIEAWLEEMAAEGLLLKEAGAYAWRFEEGEPKSVRYRIDPAVEKKGRLDSERKNDYERMGWHYAGSCRKYYYIFMADNPDTEELHTDMAVESFSLEVLERKLRLELYALISYLAVIIIGNIRILSGLIRFPLLTLTNARMIWIFPAFYACIGICWNLFAVVKIHRLRKYLAKGEEEAEEAEEAARSSWSRKQEKIRRRVVSSGIIVLIGCFALSLFQGNYGQPVRSEEQVWNLLTLEKLENGNDGNNLEDVRTESEDDFVWYRFNLLTKRNYEIFMESGEMEEEHVSFHVQYYKMRSSSLSDRMHLELLKKYISPSVQELRTTEARNEHGVFYITFREEGTQTAVARQGEQLMLIEYSGKIRLEERAEVIGGILDSEK